MVKLILIALWLWVECECWYVVTMLAGKNKNTRFYIEHNGQITENGETIIKHYINIYGLRILYRAHKAK